ncbi:uncharacterized protein EV420DRAFT_1484341 [Desarmillaria tabescens]|uniref:Uncharacterized protein n=1 Tax=Armillaria tabescens TaxID=1929756 RepID=A0AA39JM38_ARMTA|nr:uncharacterized protein EV420DRAFT_1484341 [Desarmillaria tabescens]KAK0445285.1 hypothetical protein EV420DRAFT_1484341 [Desarmillaria tabescens]
MATQTDILPDLTDHEKAFIFQFLDANLNSGILYALLHGIYTSILAVTLWNISMVTVIILLYALITINFGANWSHTHFAFIESGQSFQAVYSGLQDIQAAYWETDLVLLDGLGMTLACYSASNTFPGFCDWLRRGAEGRLRVYHRFIEILVESSALYSITLILFLVFTIRNRQGQYYLDIAASIVKELALALRSALTDRAHPNTDIAPESGTSEPYLENHSLLQDSSPPSEHVIHGSTVVDEEAVPSR